MPSVKPIPTTGVQTGFTVDDFTNNLQTWDSTVAAFIAARLKGKAKACDALHVGGSGEGMETVWLLNRKVTRVCVVDGHAPGPFDANISKVKGGAQKVTRIITEDATRILAGCL